MLMRTDPFRELDRFAQQVFGGSNARPAAMPMDAFRSEDEFVVMFDLPGVDPSSIDLTVERNVLTVHAERLRPGEGVEMLIGERPHGTFSRQLFLAETLDTDRLQADYKDGVLRLHIPVREQAKPRRVEINTSAAAPTSIETTSKEREPEPVGASS
jgi:HSP20 family protein